MKKLLLSTVFTLLAFYCVQAQGGFKADIMSYLTSEGYTPTIDEDGDVKFKLQGSTYFITVKDINDNTAAYVEMFVTYRTDTSLAKLLIAANKLNKDKFVVKASATGREADNAYTISYEFVTNNKANTLFQLGKALNTMPGAVDAFTENIPE